MAGSTDLSPLRGEANGLPSLAHQRGAGGHHGAPVDFRFPGNPYFPTAELSELLARDAVAVLRRPPGDPAAVTAELCAALGHKPQTVVPGNGVDELVTWIDHLLVQESLAVPIPGPGRWTREPMGTGRRLDMFPLQEDRGFALDVEAYVRFIRRRGSRVAVLCNPGDPDGGYLPRARVLEFLDALGDLDLVVVDESCGDHVDAEAAPSVADEAAIRPNVIVLRSLDRPFGLPGARLGYLVAGPALAGKVRRALPPGNLNSFAESLVFMIREHLRDQRESLRTLAADRESMSQRLSALPGVTVYPSQADFLLVRLPEGKDGRALSEHLLSAHGIAVRDCGDDLGIGGGFLRLAVRPREDVQRLIDGMHGFLFSVGNAHHTVRPIALSSTPDVPSAAPQPYPALTRQDAYLTSSSRPETYATPSPRSDAYPAPSSRPDAYAASSSRPDTYAASSSRPDTYAASSSRPDAYPAPSSRAEAYLTPSSRSEGYSTASARPDTYLTSSSARPDAYAASSSTDPYATPSSRPDTYTPSSSRPEAYPAPSSRSDGYPASSRSDGYPASSSRPDPYAAPSSRPEAYPASSTGPEAYLTRSSRSDTYVTSAAARFDAYPASSGDRAYSDQAPARQPMTYPTDSSSPAAAAYLADPFVVGRDDPRHGRLDPLDTSTRWRFGENTAPFDAISPTDRRPPRT
ncbi:hypothetical protein Sme01_53330 [Sphaerisporangium melleum]|uniref:Aminotransferase class I/classII large domain-containing protein n=1 Tax=Sphaerisporangium melleum TaxID=321316 RepID=A0A917VKH9_9ACTN|nr:aminotransferase class I/II-fold pyridoxal phosphate-dependent enzyme [Sphaerisporangium melleum]GGK90469.1 hypothetical protein GCM10007964_36420 [Sphaerisporangium melleum]GII72857.1 hypothetical protein Sme01_53330 [Sphaerisporangium melleum]